MARRNLQRESRSPHPGRIHFFQGKMTKTVKQKFEPANIETEDSSENGDGISEAAEKWCSIQNESIFLQKKCKELFRQYGEQKSVVSRSEENPVKAIWLGVLISRCVPDEIYLSDVYKRHPSWTISANSFAGPGWNVLSKAFGVVLALLSGSICSQWLYCLWFWWRVETFIHFRKYGTARAGGGTV